MLLSNCISANMLVVAISFFNTIKKWSIGMHLYIFKYLTIIQNIYDIVPRAVMAYIREQNKPTARTNKQKIKYNIMRFFNIAIKKYSNACAIASQKSYCAVCILCCNIFAKIKGGDIFDK